MTVALTSLEVAGLVRDIALISFFVIGSIGLLVGFGLGLRFYRRTRRLMDRVDAGVDRVEAMVDSVDSTASTVRKTATSMNRGMRAGEFARTAVSTVFGRGGDDGDKERSNGKSDDKDK